MLSTISPLSDLFVALLSHVSFFVVLESGDRADCSENGSLFRHVGNFPDQRVHSKLPRIYLVAFAVFERSGFPILSPVLAIYFVF